MVLLQTAHNPEEILYLGRELNAEQAVHDLVPLCRYLLMHLIAFPLLGQNLSDSHLCTSVSTKGSKCAPVGGKMALAVATQQALDCFLCVPEGNYSGDKGTQQCSK